MDKNTTALTIGLGLIGIVLAFFGYQSSETNTSSDEISEGGSEISQARAVETVVVADDEGDNKEVNDNVAELEAEEVVSTTRSETQSPTIREDVKQEIAKEADTWDSFWKQEYEKQNEEDDVTDF